MQTKFNTAIILGIYLLTNTLYIYKYSIRIDILNSYISSFTYLIFICLIYRFKSNLLNRTSKKTLTKLFCLIIIVFSIISIFAISHINGNNLNVDRWSALELTVEGITKGIYPYSLKDHMGNMSSNLPGLGFIGLPFYLLGDVGFLQVFTFLTLFIYLYKTKPIKQVIFCLILFIFSPAILWEFTAKSDLMSNLIISYIFIDYWLIKFNQNLFQTPITLGLIIGFLLMTRGVLIIPLTLFFLKDFINSSLKIKLVFLLTTLIAILLTCLPIVLSADNIAQILEYNPLILQTNKTPIVSYFLLLFIFIIPFYYKEKKDLLFFSIIIIFLIPFVTWIDCIIRFGWFDSIYKHKIDLSYLAMSISGILVYVSNYVKITEKKLFL